MAPSHSARVCMVAYACEPGRGSEPGAGWSWALEVGRLGPVHVVTRANNRAAIEGWSGWARWKGPRPSFVYYDLPGLARWAKRVTGAVHLYHYAWQLGARSAVRDLAERGEIDVAHHVTFGAYWYPSAACVDGVPFILGPIGGAEFTPRPLKRFLSPTGRLTESIRSLTRRLAAFDPFVRSTLRRADLVYATTNETMTAVRSIGARRVELMAHVGWRDESGTQPRRQVGDPSHVTVLSVSRLTDWKGMEIGLRAFAAMGFSRVRYVILGTGPSKRRLKRLATELGVEDRVVFKDRLSSHDAVLQLMADSDIFLHPAMHESGGMSVAEAMGVGLPCIVLNAGGPGILVDESCGFVIEPDEGVTAGIAAALDELCGDPIMRATLGERAARRIRDSFGWPARAAQVRREYESVLRASQSQLPRSCGVES